MKRILSEQELKKLRDDPYLMFNIGDYNKDLVINENHPLSDKLIAAWG